MHTDTKNIAFPRTQPTPSNDRSLLDHVYRQLQDGEVDDGLDLLHAELDELRRSLSHDSWRRFCSSAQRHPLHELLQQSPVTARAFSKPRGYAGDAVLLDLIYGITPAPAETSALGLALFDWESRTPSCQSVRERKRILGRALDEVAGNRAEANVLSIACGHVREAEESGAFPNRQLARYVALDQDELSLATVRDEYGWLGVETVRASVLSLLAGDVPLHGFDFVYATGLFDYLPQRVAVQLTTRMFDMLRSGGRLLIANFAPELTTIGYMDACMGWRLIYRQEREMLALTAKIASEDTQSRSVFRDRLGNLVFLDVTKA